jgi:hypothetical protein
MMQLRALPGSRLIDDMDAVGISGYVFDTNCRELEDLLYQVEQPEDFWAFTDQRKSRAFFQEVTRRLHNAVASAMTLRDHTKRLTDKWCGDIPETAARVEARQRGTFEVPGAAFIQQLRVVMQHRRVPEQSVQVSGGEGRATEQKYVLSRDGLLNAYEWPSRALAFLRDAPEEIHVLPLVRWYREEVDSFYAWLEDHLKQTHAGIIAEFVSREREYFILELEDRLEGFTMYPGYPGRRNPESDIFFGIMDASEQDSIRRVPVERRATLALRILETKGYLSEAIREGVRRLYEELQRDANGPDKGGRGRS